MYDIVFKDDMFLLINSWSLDIYAYYFMHFTAHMSLHVEKFCCIISFVVVITTDQQILIKDFGVNELGIIRSTCIYLVVNTSGLYHCVTVHLQLHVPLMLIQCKHK